MRWPAHQIQQQGRAGAVALVVITVSALVGAVALVVIVAGAVLDAAACDLFAW